MTDRIPLLIDTDPGVDDALALLMAFDDPRHEVVGLTIAAGNVGLDHTVRNALKLCEVAGSDAPVFAGASLPPTIAAGNVGLDHTVRNALKLCEVAGSDAPVFAGAPTPLLHPARDAAYVHGVDGFGDVAYDHPLRAAEREHAALAILRLSHVHAGKLLLVALGPLTNLALALKLDPSLPSRVARLVVMGGAVTAHGNITAAAEFNVAFDPEAAHIVFSTFPRTELADWEAVMAHGFAHERFERWLQAPSPRARFYDTISRRTRDWAAARRGEDWHSADALAMALALQPEGALEMMERPMVVELEGRHARGATIVDWRREEGRPDNVAILRRYDQVAFEARLASALAAGVGDD